MLRFALQRNRVGLFADPGLGKTLVALSWAVQKAFHNVLIVVRKDDIYTWKQEIQKHTTAKYVDFMRRTKKTWHQWWPISRPLFGLISYDSLRGWLQRKDPEHLAKAIGKFPWDAVICDESTKIKHHNTKRTRAIVEMFRGIRHKMVMTGTVTTNSLMDIFSQYNFLDDGCCFGKNFWSWRQNYFWQVPNGFDWIPFKWTKKALAAKIAVHGIRFRKKDCLDLPPKIYKTVQVQLTPAQQRIYDRLRKDFEYELLSGEVLEIDYVVAQFTKLLCITGGFVYEREGVRDIPSAKLRAISDLLTGSELAGKNKLVIWAAFNREIHLLSKCLRTLGIPYVRYWHRTTNREATRHWFLEDKSIKVFLGQVRMGIGMNELVVADTAIYYSRSLSLEHRLQSEDRIHRIGSQRHRSVTYIDILARKTVDKYVYKLLRKSKKVADELSRALIQENRKTIKQNFNRIS